MVEDAAATVRVLSWGARLELLWLLTDREYSIGSLAATLERSVATVSQQLGTLSRAVSRAGLVRERRAGRHRIHALDGRRPLELLGSVARRREPAGQRARGRRGG